MNLSNTRRRVDRFLAAYRAACVRVNEERETLSDAKEEVENVSRAQEVLQLVAQGVQQRAHEQIASVVTRCLEAIFDDPYEFRIDFQRKRGKTEARLVFLQNGNEVDPKGGAGGGVIDVASFALRLACLSLSHPRKRKVLIMDEPFKWVHSPVYRERVRNLLETLSKEMKFQFIISTGIEEIQTGKVLEV